MHRSSINQVFLLDSCREEYATLVQTAGVVVSNHTPATGHIDNLLPLLQPHIDLLSCLFRGSDPDVIGNCKSPLFEK